MTRSHDRRGRARRQTRLGVPSRDRRAPSPPSSPWSPPRSASPATARAAPLDVAALVADYAPSSAHPFSDPVCSRRATRRASPASRRTATTAAARTTTATGRSTSSASQGDPVHAAAWRCLPHRDRTARWDDDEASAGVLGLGGPRRRPGDQVQPPGLHRGDGGPARSPPQIVIGRDGPLGRRRALHDELPALRGAGGRHHGPRVNPGSLFAVHGVGAGVATFGGTISRRAPTRPRPVTPMPRRRSCIHRRLEGAGPSPGRR